MTALSGQASRMDSSYPGHDAPRSAPPVTEIAERHRPNGGFEITRVDLPVAHLAAAHEGLRVAQLSDHGGGLGFAGVTPLVDRAFARLGQRYIRGLYTLGPDRRLYVNRGVGWGRTLRSARDRGATG